GGSEEARGDRMSSIAARIEPDAIPVIRPASRGVLPSRVRCRAARFTTARLELRDEARRARGDAAGMHVTLAARRRQASRPAASPPAFRLDQRTRAEPMERSRPRRLAR